MAGDDARARGHRTQGETPAQAGDHDGERVHRGHPAREAPSSGACELADVVQRLVALRQHAEISESTLRSIVFRVLCALHGVSPEATRPGASYEEVMGAARTPTVRAQR